MKELTHIGMARREGKYGGDPKGDPFPVRLRLTKTRWYAGADRYALWWPPTSKSGRWVCSGKKTMSHLVTVLDLSTIRPMTVAELREPLEKVAANNQRNRDEIAEKLSAWDAALLEATKDLRAFDKKHGWTGDDA